MNRDIKKDRYRLIQGDCLEVMDKLIKEGIKIDCILTDVPYGTTACKWDNIIPFEPMWERINKLIKPNGAVCLFGSEPFSSALRMSNIKNYKYDWYWNKSKALGFAHCKNKPMNKVETISVFSLSKVKHKGQPNRMEYNPQGLLPYDKLVKGNKACEGDTNGHKYARPSHKEYIQEFTNYPVNILKFNNEGNTVHPTQKPILLMEYLIKTYTNENEIVLDFTMGSGSTGVACMNTNRKFIGIELDKNYFEIASKRIEEAIF